MFNLLDNLVKWLDRRFLIAYWAPVAIGLAGFALIVAMDRGFAGVSQRVLKLDSFGKIVLATAVVVAITVLASVLQALTGPMIRLYEGYPFGKLLRDTFRNGEAVRRARVAARQVARRDETGKQQKSSEAYFFFPPDDSVLRPTRLGNVIYSAEEYPRKTYAIDSVLWWPRMTAVLPEAFRSQIDGALIAMVTLLNLCSTFVVLAAAGGVYLLGWNRSAWMFAIPVVAGALLARGCYLAAVSQAVSYGNLIRVAYDFYRHLVLKNLRVPIPEELDDEMELWDALSIWIFYFHSPKQYRSPLHGDYPFEHAFRFAGASDSPAPPAA
ncbi:MAG TPA: hypothetical protein VJT67_12710 [Longimicrobiaceae bacterium]|nr:hypothetical protein [Longimicrobiaceae bacterium]